MTTRDAVERLRRQESRKAAAEQKAAAHGKGDEAGDKAAVTRSRRHSTATSNKESEDHIKSKDHAEADREQLRALRNSGRHKRQQQQAGTTATAGGAASTEGGTEGATAAAVLPPPAEESPAMPPATSPRTPGGSKGSRRKSML